MSTQRANSNRHTADFKPVQLPVFHSSIFPVFHSSTLPFFSSILPRFHSSSLLLALLLLAGTAQAASITSVTNGNWTAPGTWDGGVPGAGDDVTIAAGHTVTMDTAAQKTVQSLTINGALTHTAGPANKIDLVVTPGNLTVSTTGIINVNGCGYAAGTGPVDNGELMYGGTHGGEGGSAYAGSGTPRTGVPPSPPYGSVTNPVTPGGAGRGGNGGNGHPGGGVVIISCLSGDVTITAPGKITSDGSPHDGCNGSAGAGGTVNISAARLLGTGSLSANGGDEVTGANCGGAAGGGGRIAVVLSGAAAPVGYTISARGGNGLNATPGYGAAGTIYLKGSDSTLGLLKIANPVTIGGSGAKTLLPAGTYQFDSISIEGGNAILAVGSGVTLNLDGCTVTTTSGGKVVQKGTGVLNWTGTYTNTYTISQQGNGTWTLPGDLVVGTGGALTHEPRWLRTEDASTWLNMDIGSNNLTVGPGTINVQGKGTDGGNNDQGGVHGGEGGSTIAGGAARTPTFGSITNPVTAGGGSGGSSRAKGGGVMVILRILP